MNEKRLGYFAVINLDVSSFNMPSFYQGKPFYLAEVKDSIITIRFGRGIKKNIGVNDLALFSEILADKMAVIFFDDDEMFLCPYRLGEEHIMKFLKERKI